MTEKCDTILANLHRVKSALESLTRGGDGSNACVDLQYALAIIAEELGRNLETLDEILTET